MRGLVEHARGGLAGGFAGGGRIGGGACEVGKAGSRDEFVARGESFGADALDLGEGFEGAGEAGALDRLAEFGEGEAELVADVEG